MDKKSKKTSEKIFPETPSMSAVNSDPDDVSELINSFGTYNIQPTNASADNYPAISQGLDKERKEKSVKMRNKWKEENTQSE